LTLIIGTRGSALALAQTQQFAAALAQAAQVRTELRVISTRGDRIQDRPLAAIGGKGLFTLELEQALRSGEIQLAVHSLKDLPTADPVGLVIGCVPLRASPWDVIIGHLLADLPQGAVVGTGSLRRRAQLKAIRPDLVFRDIRGNVDTRLRKLHEQDYDAIVLARAGILRVGLELGDIPNQDLDPSICLPAPGQGALAIQCRADDGPTLAVLRAVEHDETRACVRAERAFLAAVEGGCNVPAGAYATITQGLLKLETMMANEAGKLTRQAVTGAPASAVGLGREAAGLVLAALA
jgi:hydroxymethylbilane synthase